MEKLVRDKIPEIIKKKYGNVDFYKANKEEYRKFLFKKVLEEAEEVYCSKNKQELIMEIADLLEVIGAIIKNENIDISELNKIKERKKLEK
jgi:predicted house-cleaning noncanonical NTP pyrophosphatase (MazG superfamily)